MNLQESIKDQVNYQVRNQIMYQVWDKVTEAGLETD